MGQIINSIDIVEEKISLEDARSMAIMHQGEVFTYYDEGCTRYVYVNKDESKVIKIDKMRGSHKWNQDEIDIYTKISEENRKQMVPTRMFNGIIEQDFVTPIKYGGKKLTIPQRLFANSCRGEVGWTEDGKLLCFDLDEFKKY